MDSLVVPEGHHAKLRPPVIVHWQYIFQTLLLFCTADLPDAGGGAQSMLCRAPQVFESARKD